MKYIVGIVLIFIGQYAFSESAEFDIVALGLSDSTDTIYIVVSPEVPGSACPNKSQLRLSTLDSSIANMAYSAALMAVATERKIHVTYDPGSCINNATKIAAIAIK